MDFLFTGVCKMCGTNVQFCISPYALEELEIVMQCPHCGASASFQDCEKMYHLIDTLQTTIERNSFVEIKSIYQSRMP